MSFVLNNGVVLPTVGFGTYRIRGRDLIYSCLDTALGAGYKCIDTARIYRNEDDIGAALPSLLGKYSLKREDLFITSKLSPRDQGYESCLQSVQESLRSLQTDYLDLYLIHWPGCSGMQPQDTRNVAARKGSWLALEHLYKQGVLKAIGVSNYTIQHLTELLDTATVVPQVNQVECHPHFPQKELRDLCEKAGIHVQAYSSLGTTTKQLTDNKLLNEVIVQDISQSLQRTPAQVLLRWALQQNMSVLPKSCHPGHIRDNIQLDFHLSEQDITLLNSLPTRTKYAWNPEVVV